MRTSLRPYPEYRESGLPWLGRIPTHWQVRRNGYLFAPRNETGFGELPILEVSLNTGVRVRDFDGTARKQVMSDREKYKRAAQGDITYNMMRLWQGAIGVAPTDGLVSPAYVVARPYPDTLSSYFVEMYRTDAYKAEVNKYSRGIVSDRNRLYWDEFKQMPVCVPPPVEQAAIVRFLDHADQKIRQFVQAKRRLIEFLNEQKEAIINRAVIHGLDPNILLKSSGINWLGNIPEHWEVVRFKDRVGIQEGPGIMATDFRDSGVPLLRISCLARAEANLEGCNFLDPDMVEIRWHHFRVQPGDYLLSASARTGGVSRATDAVHGAIPYTGIIRLWPLTDGVNMEYLRHFMNSRPFAEQIDAAKSGVGIEHFGPTHLKRMWITLPPASEQQAIVDRLDDSLKGFDSLIRRTQSGIGLIREYRTRLIADVVTGKLDVREAADRLPSSVEPDVPDDDSLGLSAFDPEGADGPDDDAPELIPDAADEG